MRLAHLVPAFAALCACSTVAQPPGPLIGEWGGTHVGLKLTDGAARSTMIALRGPSTSR